MGVPFLDPESARPTWRHFPQSSVSPELPRHHWSGPKWASHPTPPAVRRFWKCPTESYVKWPIDDRHDDLPIENADFLLRKLLNYQWVPPSHWYSMTGGWTIFEVHMIWCSHINRLKGFGMKLYIKKDCKVEKFLKKKPWGAPFVSTLGNGWTLASAQKTLQISSKPHK